MKKNIVNIKNILLALTAVVSLSLSSCIDPNMNKNPMNPTSTDIGPLFNGVVSSLTANSNEQFYLWNEIFYPETELGALTSEAWGNVNIGVDAVWNNYYLALANIHEIDKRLDELCATTKDDQIDDKVRAQLTVIEAYKTFKVTDMFGDIPYSEAGYIWYNTEANRKPKYDSQESIYKTLLNELVWARNILNDNKSKTESGNTYYSLGAYDVMYHNDYYKWAKIANSLILRHGLRMYDKDKEFAQPILTEAFNKYSIGEPMEDFLYSSNGAFVLWPQYLGQNLGDEGWAFREHKNLRMGETAFAQMSNDTIFDPRVYIFFDTNNDDEWKAYPQMRDANTPTEGGAPYSSSRDKTYTFKNPSCLYSPFNYYLIRDHVFVPQVLISQAEVCFIKAELLARGIVPGGFNGPFGANGFLRKGIESSLKLWLQLPMYGTDATYKYVYKELQEILNEGDIYTIPSKYASIIMTEKTYYNPFEGDENAYLELIHQQRWLDLFRQANEAWSLSRRTLNTPTTIDHKKLVTYRLPYPQSEITYNNDNYNEQVKKMSHGDTRETKVWWMDKN